MHLLCAAATTAILDVALVLGLSNSDGHDAIRPLTLSSVDEVGLQDPLFGAFSQQTAGQRLSSQSL